VSNSGAPPPPTAYGSTMDVPAQHTLPSTSAESRARRAPKDLLVELKELEKDFSRDFQTRLAGFMARYAFVFVCLHY
jgi:hypothetical protein